MRFPTYNLSLPLVWRGGGGGGVGNNTWVGGGPLSSKLKLILVQRINLPERRISFTITHLKISLPPASPAAFLNHSLLFPSNKEHTGFLWQMISRKKEYLLPPKI